MVLDASSRRIAYIAILALAYFIAARLGLSLQAVNEFAALIWPPSGIAIVVLLLFGRNLWPGVMLGAFFANFSIGASIPEALGIAIGNTLEATLALYFLNRLGVDRVFPRLRDTMGFILVAVTAPIVSATLGVSTLVLGGSIPSSQFLLTWIPWWIGDMLGALILVPFVLSWIAPQFYKKTVAEEIERVAAITVTTATAFFIFWMASSVTLPPFLYPIFIPLAWTAIRTGLRSTTLCIFLLAILAETGALFGRGVFYSYGQDTALLWTQLFIGVSAAGFLILATIARERKADQRAMASNLTKLEAALKRISGEDRAKSEFIAILAHELRNPLAPVLSTLEFMQLETVGANAEVLKSVESIRHHIKSVSRLLDDLLDISRINNKKYRLERSVIELGSVITHAVNMSAPAIRARNHTISVSLPESPVHLNADPVRLEQIIANVLNNAAKFTPPNGKIYISVVPQEGAVSIIIRDNGIGIDEEASQYIFEPFRRASDHQRETPGLGLGLSLTKRLVELHGGTISMHSGGKNLGSEFIITLPTTVEKAAPVEKLKEIAPSKQKHRVLVVDDNKPAADGLAKLLRHFGYETALAYDGTEALQAIEKFRPSVAVLDIGLPGMSGYEVAQKVRLLSGGPALVAVTGYGQSTDKLRARDSGFAYHLTKPVGIRDLTNVLDKINT